MGASRLGSISVSEGKSCRESNANTSQKGNYANFRNEKLGYTPVEVRACSHPFSFLTLSFSLFCFGS